MKLEINSQNICAGCPGFRALEERVDQIFDSKNGLTETEQAEGMNLVAKSAYDLDRAAGMIACRKLEKELPNEDTPLPATGDPARIAFVARCPAYSIYKKMQTAGNN